MTTENSNPSIQANFNPLIRPYLVIYIGFFLFVTIVFIPVALLWFCGIGQWWAKHYFAKLKCELSDTHLQFRKGIIFQVEKTIPLENIQDITFIEGPLLKHFNLSTIKLETAGQSVGQAHDMSLIGIIDAHDFRANILSKRESVRKELSTNISNSSGNNDNLEVLHKILARLDDISNQLRKN